MIVTLLILFAMLLGEPIPWWVPLVTGGLALAVHGIFIMGELRGHIHLRGRINGMEDKHRVDTENGGTENAESIRPRSHRQ